MDGGYGGGGGGWDRGQRSQQDNWGGRSGGGGGFQGQRDDRNRGGFAGVRSGGRDDDSLEIEVSCRDVPRIIGRGGSKIKELEEQSGARIKIRKDKDNGVTTVVELRGSPDAQQSAKDLIEDYVASRDSYGGGGGGPRNFQGSNRGYGGGGGGGGGRSYGGGGFGGQDRYNDPGIEIAIPTSSIARVIGRGGSKIRELQEDSGARIKILREREEGSNTFVEIRGDEDAQEKAKKLLEEFIVPQDGSNSYDRY